MVGRVGYAWSRYFVLIIVYPRYSGKVEERFGETNGTCESCEILAGVVISIVRTDSSHVERFVGFCVYRLLEMQLHSNTEKSNYARGLLLFPCSRKAWTFSPPRVLVFLFVCPSEPMFVCLVFFFTFFTISPTVDDWLVCRTRQSVCFF